MYNVVYWMDVSKKHTYDYIKYFTIYIYTAAYKNEFTRGIQSRNSFKNI